MSGPTSQSGQRVPQTHDPLTTIVLLHIPQGIIRAAKELDYEISHGRYTLIVTATDQCPLLSHRLTSTTMVGGWVGGTRPQLGQLHGETG